MNGETGLIGRARLRVEDARLLRGQGRFPANERADGALHALVLRSPVAHGRIAALDLEAARAMPGVVGVFAARDLKPYGLAPMPCLSPVDGMRAPDRYPLAVDIVRHVGEPVALVVAETLAQARDAVEAIVLDVEERPAVVETAQGEPCFTWQTGNAALTERLFAEAAHVVTLETVNNRIVVAPLEPRSAIAEWLPDTESYRLITQSQGVHFLAQCLAPALSVGADRLEVFTRDVGGSFGMKLVGFPEQAAILLAARALGRVIRWESDRTEAFLSDAQARDHAYAGALALDADGRFLAFRLTTKAAMGAYLSGLGPYVPTKGMKRTLGHVYALQAVHMRVEGVLTHTAPTDAYRGAGKPESVYILERVIDKAARVLGLDRVELRRRNLVPAAAMPFQAASGEVYDSGDFADPMEAALQAADWDGFPARRADSAVRGMRRGIGLGLYLHATGGVTTETVQVTLTEEGVVEVATGLQASGQGHETVLAQIVADRLDIDPARIRVIEGEGFRVCDSSTGGSSSMPIGGATAQRAADAFLEAARARAADLLEVAAVDITYEAGSFTVAGTDRRMALVDLGRATAEAGLPGCAADAAFEGTNFTYPVGAHVAEVELDPETGRVRLLSFVSADDLGTKVNPMLADGQIHGGLAQGIGQALLERTVYDPESGQMLSASFMDYALPRADDLPSFQLVDRGRPTAANPLGAKGAGEVGTIGAPGAVMNAIADALGHDAIHMPATPQTVWQAVKHGG